MVKLKEIRKKRGLTQQQVAEYLYMATTTYQSYEQGKAEPNIDTLIKLSKLFNLSIDDIVGNNNIKKLKDEQILLLENTFDFNVSEFGRVLGYIERVKDERKI